MTHDEAMASLAVLVPLVSKTADVIAPMATVLPKKRIPVAGGVTRSRFAKARPNVGALANKAAKEAPDPEKEKASTSLEPNAEQVSVETPHLVKAEPIVVSNQKEVESFTRNKPTKAKPNVGDGLVNKGATEAPRPVEEKVSKEPKLEEVSVEIPPPVKAEPKPTAVGFTRNRFTKARPNVGGNKVAVKASIPVEEKVSVEEEHKPMEISQETPCSVESEPKTAPVGFTRNRFTKATPNVGGGLAKKDAKSAPEPAKEKVSTLHEEPKSKEVLQETPLPVEVEPKTAPVGFTRRRLAKARPNVGALSNKSAKEAPKPVKERVSAIEEEAKPKEVSQETISPLKEDPNSIKGTASDLCLTRCEEVVKEVSSSTVLSASESEQPVLDVTPYRSSIQEIYSVESLAETSPRIAAPPEVPPLQVNSPTRQHITPSTPSTTTVAKTPVGTPPYSGLTVVPARTNTPIALPAPRTPSKQEYPTLKGVLNSPRKRISTKKHNERRKRFANGAEPPPRSEMTISDLIYFNPAGTAVTVKKRNTCTTVVPIEEIVEPEPEKTEEEAPSGPQVMINEKGEIVLNEASLLVKRKDTVDHSLPFVIEDDNTTYASFRNKASRQWTTKETTKFYKTLKLVGTDFALMEKIFEVNGMVTRSRKELKCKYKREERLNTKLVHQAIYDTQTFEISILENESEEDPDDPVIEKKKTRGKRKKKDNPEPPLESSSANEQSDEQKESGSELSLVPSEQNPLGEGLQEISVQINGELYHSADADGTECSAEYTTSANQNCDVNVESLLSANQNSDENVESLASANQNGDTLPVKRRGRKRKIKDPIYYSESSWEDTSEVYPFNEYSKKIRKTKANIIVSSADESQGDPMEMVCLSDKNVSNAVKLAEHRTTEDNLCMDAMISEVLTTRRGRPKSKPASVPSFSSFTPAEEEEEEEKEPTVLEEESEEVLVELTNESHLSETTQNGEISEVEIVEMEVEDGPSFSSVEHRTWASASQDASVIEPDDRLDVAEDCGDQIILTQTSDSENMVHVFVVKSAGEHEPHQS